MLIYKKYIIKTILWSLVTLMLVITGLIWVTHILKLFPLLEKGIGIINFCYLTILMLPSLLYTIIPLISLLAILYSYNKLQEERQLIILRISGLSNLALIKPALIVSLLITILSYYLSVYLMPLSYNKLKQELNYYKENYISQIIDTRTFTQISKDVTIYIDGKNANGEFTGIVLFNNSSLNNETIFFAKSGRLTVINQKLILTLKNGLRQSFDPENNLTRLYFTDLTVEIKNENNDEIINRSKSNLELYISEMLFPDQKLPLDKQRQIIAEGHQRLIWPLYSYIFPFLGLSQFLTHSYTRNSNIKQIGFTVLPIISVAYFHFTCQKLAYEQDFFTFCCYLNIILTILFSIYQSIRKSI